MYRSLVLKVAYHYNALSFPYLSTALSTLFFPILVFIGWLFDTTFNTLDQIIHQTHRTFRSNLYCMFLFFWPSDSLRYLKSWITKALKNWSSRQIWSIPLLSKKVTDDYDIHIIYKGKFVLYQTFVAKNERKSFRFSLHCTPGPLFNFKHIFSIIINLSFDIDGVGRRFSSILQTRFLKNILVNSI